LVVWLAANSCQKTNTTAAADRQIDVCELISREEAQSIQGSPVKDVKGNVNTNGGFRTSDCVYTGQTNDQSVTLSLVQKNAGSPNAVDPKQYWKTSFSRYSDEAKEHDAEAENEKSADEHEIEVHPANVQPPKKIDGLGDAAFWMTDFNGGALYVLKRDLFLRIRVNGPESEESRIDKSRQLAAKALIHL
jgi:hypothetical protein